MQRRSSMLLHVLLCVATSGLRMSAQPSGGLIATRQLRAAHASMGLQRRPQQTEFSYKARLGQQFITMEDSGDDESSSENSEQDGQKPKRRQRIQKRLGFLGRFSRRLKEGKLPEPEEIDLGPIVKDVDAAIASRRRRLNAKMGSTLKEVREVGF